MSAALTPPFLLAALLVCVAGGLKLRAPWAAAAALRTLGLPAGSRFVRVMATGEIVLGAACVVHPTEATAAVLTAAYATFAGVAAALARRRVACGCFGEADAPTTFFHAIASLVLAGVALASALSGPRGLAWLASRPAATAAVLAVALAGALYALVLVYTKAPRAWTAWSGE